MADIDKQKEWVTFLRMLLFFILSLVVALTGYIFNNFEHISNLKLIILNVIEFILIIISITVFVIMYKEINKLKDL